MVQDDFHTFFHEFNNICQIFVDFNSGLRSFFHEFSFTFQYTQVAIPIPIHTTKEVMYISPVIQQIQISGNRPRSEQITEYEN